MSLSADDMILTECALQIAAGEKHGAGALRAADTGFLTEMRFGTVYGRCGERSAESADSVFRALNSALSGTIIAYQNTSPAKENLP